MVLLPCELPPCRVPGWTGILIALSKLTVGLHDVLLLIRVCMRRAWVVLSILSSDSTPSTDNIAGQVLSVWTTSCVTKLDVNDNVDSDDLWCEHILQCQLSWTLQCCPVLILSIGVWFFPSVNCCKFLRNVNYLQQHRALWYNILSDGLCCVLGVVTMGIK